MYITTLLLGEAQLRLQPEEEEGGGGPLPRAGLLHTCRQPPDAYIHCIYTTYTAGGRIRTYTYIHHTCM